MFCRKNQYLKIQKIHHKALKVVLNIDDGYEELLQMSNEITIHEKHLYALICEVFKGLKVVSATFLLRCFLSLNESTCQTRKKFFYFTSKALFVLEKIKF